MPATGPGDGTRAFGPDDVTRAFGPDDDTRAGKSDASARAAIAASFGPVAGEICLAVSGGGDSLALLALAADWAAGQPGRLSVVTLDHGLRPEAAEEARAVARRAASLGLPQTTLHWHPAAPGNLSEAAREARRDMIAAHARARGAAAVALAHTADDQAETVLMRLARGSGVAGLSGMAPRSLVGDMPWLRPLLGIRRAALRDILRARGWDWAEDPSNDDPAYDRVLVRRLIAGLGPLGLDVGRLTRTAAHMAEARAALDAGEAELARQALVLRPAGVAEVDLPALLAAPAALRHQLLADLLVVISGGRHPPGHAALARLGAALSAGGGGGGGRSLHGCLLRPDGGRLVICREPGRCAGPEPLRDGMTWDGRWRIRAVPDGSGSTPEVPRGAVVGALGPAGLAQIRAVNGLRPDGGTGGRAGGGRLPRAEHLHATPAIWHDGAVIAAPLCGFGTGWQAEAITRDARRCALLGWR